MNDEVFLVYSIVFSLLIFTATLPKLVRRNTAGKLAPTAMESPALQHGLCALADAGLEWKAGPK